MKQLYEKQTANYPRLSCDKFFADYDNEFSFSGITDTSMRFIENAQLLKPSLWKRFVEQFKLRPDSDHRWRGEFWGKMMRGACFVYSYTKNPELYRTLSETVSEMISVQEESGRISSYNLETEFKSWDMWCRKYVLLGMQYFLEICTDQKLYAEVVDSMCRQADYIMKYIGPEEGKMQITDTAGLWRGAASSSILEPFVRLYSITGKKQYFDFATYIIRYGGIDVDNVFELAYENKLYPYQYPITKAYEMTSCFEGLLEYYRITGEEKCKTSVINFADKLLESDFTIVGSAGCTHELFDHSSVRQANTNNGLLGQETCVTVTLMKFMYQMTLLTGNPKYADAFECSFYNAYLGAVNTEGKIGAATLPEGAISEPLPFDSYSPLTVGKRGNAIGGFCLMPDNHYYGCCACIASAGAGLVPKIALLSAIDGFAVNLFLPGTIQSTTPSGGKITFVTETTYPVSGSVKITLNLDTNEEFALYIRNPKWSKNTQLLVNGTSQKSANGYIKLQKTWRCGDVIELILDMRTEAIRPTPYGHQLINTKIPVKFANYMVAVYDEEDPIAKHHIAYRRGPIILAQDSRLGYDLSRPIAPITDEDGYADAALTEDIAYPHIVGAVIPLKDGKSITLSDYASSGKTWSDESLMAAWILTE